MSGETSTNEAPGQREALTRVLAIEGRNTLARVELAASELARHEAPPSIRERIETIRNAANEIDTLLGKIDLLATPRIRKRWEPVEVVPVLQRVVARLAPALRARGVTLEGVEPGGGSDVILEMPEATLERLLVGFLRLALCFSDRPGNLLVAVDSAQSTVQVSIRLPAHDVANFETAAARDARIQFEVQLAEWGGGCFVRPQTGQDSLELILPIESSHA